MAEARLTFRETVERGLKDDGYEPQLLWLVPVYLRSRIQYYDEAVARIRNELDEAWRRYGSTYGSREEFENSSFVNSIWNSNSPFWWGLNDIVGYIDVRACVRHREIQAALFLTSKRASRRLKDKTYVFRRTETAPIANNDSNRTLQDKTLSLIQVLAKDQRIRTRHIDLEPWRRLLRHTNLVSIIREAAIEDMERISKARGELQTGAS